MPVLLLLLVAVVFAVQAVRSGSLLASALWLAGVSALTATVLYLFGAAQLAVIELSVGTGLVTVLFVLAINIAGDDPLTPHPLVPKGLAAGCCLLVAGVVAWMALSSASAAAGTFRAADLPLAQMLWQRRGLDMLLQVVLIFSGVLGMLGLLSERRSPLDGGLAEEVAEGRDRDLQRLENQLHEKPEAGQ